MSNRYITRYVTFFNPPITTKVPTTYCTLEELHRCITGNGPIREKTIQVRMEMPNEAAYRKAKTHLLPLVTPAGVFEKRCSEGMIHPNGLGVLDFDHLESMEAAKKLRDALFDDPHLQAELAFVSPSGHGVKLFIPYTIDPSLPFSESYRRRMHSAWEYIEAQYEVKADEANIDITRGCLICHDPEAKFRVKAIV